MSTPDNYDIWEQHQRRLDNSLERRPKCAICEEHIQEEMAFELNGYWICSGCIALHTKEVPNE
jgi:formylmethanofuran dehydrogenase subunit E